MAIITAKKSICRGSDFQEMAQMCGRIEGVNLKMDGLAVAREAEQAIVDSLQVSPRPDADLLEVALFLRKRLDAVLLRMCSAYDHYRREVKAGYEFTEIEPYLKGPKVLDYGSGGGVLIRALRDHGYDVMATDTIDWRDNQNDEVPFQKLECNDVLPWSDHYFDTVLVYAVLHHIDPAELVRVLRELHRTGKRVIVKEDVTDIRGNGTYTAFSYEAGHMLQKFMELSPHDRFRFTALRDWFANVIKGGIDQMNLPFAFRSILEWKELFLRAGFEVRSIQLNGYAKTGHWLNSNCHTIFVLDAMG